MNICRYLYLKENKEFSPHTPITNKVFSKISMETFKAQRKAMGEEDTNSERRKQTSNGGILKFISPTKSLPKQSDLKNFIKEGDLLIDAGGLFSSNWKKRKFILQDKILYFFLMTMFFVNCFFIK